jgi:hypothetical protein
MVLCPEFSFIQFNDTLDDCCCERPLEVKSLLDISFHVDIVSPSGSRVVTISITDISGKIILHNIKFVGYEGWLTFPSTDLSEILADQDCFRFMIEDTIGNADYSNVFIFSCHTDWVLVNYSSKITKYFPFAFGESMKLRLPIEIINRNPKTETEEYTDANGRINNPYKTRRDVYKLNVDYSPVEFHKKIQVMLMHDVFIDGVEINETGDYEINYGESIHVNNRYLYMASTEVSEQEILLMRNY